MVVSEMRVEYYSCSGGVILTGRQLPPMRTGAPVPCEYLQYSDCDGPPEKYGDLSMPRRVVQIAYPRWVSSRATHWGSASSVPPSPMLPDQARQSGL